MKDKWLVTMEVETFDGDPKMWDWDKIFIGEDVINIVSSDFVGRVLPVQGESK